MNTYTIKTAYHWESDDDNLVSVRAYVVEEGHDRIRVTVNGHNLADTSNIAISTLIAEYAPNSKPEVLKTGRASDVDFYAWHF